MSLRPICTNCAVEMECFKNEFLIRAGSRIYNGDNFKCPSCGTEVVVGFGQPRDVPDCSPETIEEALEILR